jgi:hypothetical protein
MPVIALMPATMHESADAGNGIAGRAGLPIAAFVASRRSLPVAHVHPPPEPEADFAEMRGRAETRFLLRRCGVE